MTQLHRRSDIPSGHCTTSGSNSPIPSNDEDNITSRRRRTMRQITTSSNKIKRHYTLHLYNIFLIILGFSSFCPQTVDAQSSSSSSSTGTSTSSSSTSSGLDEDLVTRWDDSIDFEGCFSDLLKADRDGNGAITQKEYLNFIQEYGKRICFKTNKLSLQQSATFNSLACICRNQEGAKANCCLGNNAKIPTKGAKLSRSKRQPYDQNYLTSVCKLTDATIDARCPPIINERDKPIVPILPADEVNAASNGNGGLPWWAWLLIALAALLLFCFGFCCVWKRRVKRETEEEENVNQQQDDEEKYTVTAMGKKVDGDPLYPEQPIDRPILKSVPPPEPREPYEVNSTPFPVTLRPVNPLAQAAAARGAVFGDPDSDEEEEIRKNRGGGRLPDEEPEEIVKIIGAPPIPPVEEPPKEPRGLRPIPPKETDSDEWDHPGRNIEYPVEKDDDSAQILEPYVPDGGVYLPERPTSEPLDWRLEWQRQKPEEPDEVDRRKHRIQSGLGEGEVWNKLDDDESSIHELRKKNNDAFDWVIQSALGALDDNQNSPKKPTQEPQNHTQYNIRKSHNNNNHLPLYENNHDDDDAAYRMA